MDRTFSTRDFPISVWGDKTLMTCEVDPQCKWQQLFELGEPLWNFVAKAVEHSVNVHQITPREVRET